MTFFYYTATRIDSWRIATETLIRSCWNNIASCKNLRLWTWSIYIFVWQRNSQILRHGGSLYRISLASRDGVGNGKVMELCSAKCMFQGVCGGFLQYPLARNQYINNSPRIFFCIRAGANTGATCIRPEIISLKNFANMQKMTPQKYFPVFARCEYRPRMYSRKN